MGIVPTFYDSRLVHHRDAIEAMARGRLNVLTPIGRTVKFAEAVAAGKPLHQYEPGNVQVDALRTLTGQVETWLRSRA